MKAGEYVGADGAPRQWKAGVSSAEDFYQLMMDDGRMYGIDRADLRPAAAALLALADELETEYVLLDSVHRLTLTPENKRVEEYRDGMWSTARYPANIAVQAFRAGQERGQR